METCCLGRVRGGEIGEWPPQPVLLGIRRHVGSEASDRAQWGHWRNVGCLQRALSGGRLHCVSG